jgi:hypothetical protein
LSQERGSKTCRRPFSDAEEEESMAYPCPNCRSVKTAASYYHQCIGRIWYTTIYPAPDPNPLTGKPEPVSCPDGLLDTTNPAVRRSSIATACSNPGLIQASSLYCYNCRTQTLFNTTD